MSALLNFYYKGYYYKEIDCDKEIDCHNEIDCDKDVDFDKEIEYRILSRKRWFKWT